MKNICIFTNDAFSLLHFRSSLINELRRKGNKVTTVLPHDPKYDTQVKELCDHVIYTPFVRNIDLKSDFKYLYSVFRILAQTKYDIIHCLTIKPVAFVPIVAAMLNNNNVFGLVSGAGHSFSNPSSVGQKVKFAFIHKLLKLSFLFIKRCWFQNPDDIQLFVSKKIIKRYQALLIRGSGIDSKKYSMQNISSDEIDEVFIKHNLVKDVPLILMVCARNIASKGIIEFVEACDKLKKNGFKCQALLVSPIEKFTYEYIDVEILKNKYKNVVTIETNFVSNIKSYVGSADICVLPSYYREGVPRFLIEALSLSKPIITTDSVGCKEVVKENWNGYKIKPKSVDDLYEKLSLLLKDQSKRIEFGKNSRQLCEEEFCDEVVIKKVTEQLYQI